MPKISFAEQVLGWEQLVGSAEKYADELPDTAELRAELAAAIAESKAGQDEYYTLRGRMLDAAERMRQAVARGEEAESRLRRIFQAAHGAASPLLHRYGIKPRRERRRAKEQPSVEPETALSPGETGDAPGGG
jgi:hypothetical protein